MDENHKGKTAYFMSKQNQPYLTAFLFAVYLLVLIWIIVFKLRFSLSDIPFYRSVNLVPLQGSAYGKLSAEVLNNLYIFIPFGLYLSMLMGNGAFLRKTLTIAIVSAAFECVQYLLAIGASDITDIIANTLGGITGIVIYAVLSSVFKTKTNRILNGLALVITISSAAFFGFVLFYRI